MNYKIKEIKTQKIEIALTPEEKTTVRQLLNEIDTIYHCEPSNSDDMKIIANLRTALIDFENRYM